MADEAAAGANTQDGLDVEERHADCDLQVVIEREYLACDSERVSVQECEDALETMYAREIDVRNPRGSPYEYFRLLLALAVA